MKRIGVLGYGRRIEGVIDNVVEQADDKAKVVAFYDSSDKAISRIAEKDASIRACDSVEQVVSADDIDWVFIGSFNAAHHEHVIPALKAGKHVFCEKPLATTLEDCLDIHKTRKAHANSQFAVGFVLRYSAFYRAIRKLIEQDKVGELISMELNETLSPDHGAAMHGNWRRRSEFAGPMILEKCCHDIDIMHWLTDSRPAKVASFGSLRFFKAANADRFDAYPPTDKGHPYYGRGLATGFAVGDEHNINPFSDDKDTIDNQVAIMQLENGAHVSFHYCMHSAIKERRFYMCGTKGSIRADVLTGTIEYKPVGWETETETIKPISGDGHGGAEGPMTDDIIACMFDNMPMPTTLEDGLAASFSCFGMEKSRETGQIVDMNEFWKLLD